MSVPRISLYRVLQIGCCFLLALQARAYSLSHSCFHYQYGDEAPIDLSAGMVRAMDEARKMAILGRENIARPREQMEEDNTRDQLFPLPNGLDLLEIKGNKSMSFKNPKLNSCFRSLQTCTRQNPLGARSSSRHPQNLLWKPGLQVERPRMVRQIRGCSICDVKQPAACLQRSLRGLVYLSRWQTEFGQA
jgi:hypothetical protein